MHLPVGYCPHELGGFLFAMKISLTFGISEPKDLGIFGNEFHSMAWIDFVARKTAQLG
jgi:hypothetical protein